MMNTLTRMSDIMIPMVIFLDRGVMGWSRGEGLWDFLKGAKRGLRIVVEILPTLVGLMMMAVGFSGPPVFEPAGASDRTCHTGSGTFGIAGTLPHCENVLSLCGNRAGTGYFKDLWPGLYAPGC